jgi:hypothetical protein
MRIKFPRKDHVIAQNLLLFEFDFARWEAIESPVVYWF